MSSQAKIVHAEWVDNGVVVSFEDGRSAFYPAQLLESTLPQARLIGKDEPLPAEWAVHPPDRA